MLVQNYPISSYQIKKKAISHKGAFSDFLNSGISFSTDSFEKTANKSEQDIIKGIVGEDKEIKWNRNFNPQDMPIKYFKVIDKKRSNILFNHISDLITYYYDQDNRMTKFLRFNMDNGDISIYDKNGNQIKHYYPWEGDALIKYKGNSSSIHDVLRYGKKVKNQDTIEKYIKTLSSLYENDDKISVAEEDMYVYRALDPHCVNQIKQNLSNGKMTYVDPSFVSVSTDKEVPKFFSKKNIAKIKIPKGTKYISLDEFANLEYTLQQEKELLLNKNSKFSFTNTKDEDGFFEVEYLGE